MNSRFYQMGAYVITSAVDVQRGRDVSGSRDAERDGMPRCPRRPEAPAVSSPARGPLRLTAPASFGVDQAGQAVHVMLRLPTFLRQRFGEATSAAFAAA